LLAAAVAELEPHRRIADHRVATRVVARRPQARERERVDGLGIVLQLLDLLREVGRHLRVALIEVLDRHADGHPLHQRLQRALEHRQLRRLRALLPRAPHERIAPRALDVADGGERAAATVALLASASKWRETLQPGTSVQLAARSASGPTRFLRLSCVAASSELATPRNATSRARASPPVSAATTLRA